MNQTALLQLASLIVIGAGIAYTIRRRSRRYTTPSPPAWPRLLARTFPPINHMDPTQQAQLFNHMQRFLTDKHFEGCGGLELNDEIKVTIAALACMLLIGRTGNVYPRLRTVLVYPHTYRSGRTLLFGEGENEEVRLGESWDRGVVVLSWANVRNGARNFDDGYNLAIHEFAHQLDQEDGLANGVPNLPTRAAYQRWQRIFSYEYTQLNNAVERGQKTLIDAYGATHPAEFFAVATETFFEKPRQLQERHPGLFEELCNYYRIDPRQWIRHEKGTQRGRAKRRIALSRGNFVRQ